MNMSCRHTYNVKLDHKINCKTRINIRDLIVLLQSKHRTAAKQNSKAPHKTQTTPNQQNNHKSKP
jgi:hypothetical protein